MGAARAKSRRGDEENAREREGERVRERVREREREREGQFRSEVRCAHPALPRRKREIVCLTR
jgi:hypothetical protein